MEKFRTFSIGIRLYRCFKFCAFHASNFDEELAEEEEDEYEAPRNDDDDDDGAKRRKFFVVVIVLPLGRPSFKRSSTPVVVVVVVVVEAGTVVVAAGAGACGLADVVPGPAVDVVVHGIFLANFGLGVVSFLFFFNGICATVGGT